MPADASAWKREFAHRLRPLLERMQSGEDVPPAAWYRAEGFAEAGLAGGSIDAAGLAALLDELYREVLGTEVATRFGEPASSWIDAAACRVQLRFRLPRAPVFPSTSA